jgi:3-oxosteroid 1-dehydrogenase
VPGSSAGGITEFFGGSTARSGSGLWIPNSYLLEQAIVPDSFENGRL